MTTVADGWETAATYDDILFQKSGGIARISINRPEVHNAFRPKTVHELIEAFQTARHDPEVGVILFTGEGGRAFCSGGTSACAATAATLLMTAWRGST